MNTFKFLSWDIIRYSKHPSKMGVGYRYNDHAFIDKPWLKVSQLSLGYKGSNRGFYDYMIRNQK